VLDLALIARRGWRAMSSSRAALAALTMKWWSSESVGQQGRHTKFTTLDFRRADFGLFRDLLGRVPWIKPWREEGPKKAGQYSRITFSKLRSDASQQ